MLPLKPSASEAIVQRWADERHEIDNSPGDCGRSDAPARLSASDRHDSCGTGSPEHVRYRQDRSIRGRKKAAIWPCCSATDVGIEGGYRLRPGAAIQISNHYVWGRQGAR